LSSEIPAMTGKITPEKRELFSPFYREYAYVSKESIFPIEGKIKHTLVSVKTMPSDYKILVLNYCKCVKPTIKSKNTKFILHLVTSFIVLR
jgi:hypothetical protein